MQFSHGSVFSDSRNVQKCVTQIIYLGSLPRSRGLLKLNESVICAVREFWIKTSKNALRGMSEEEKSSNQLLENAADLLDDLGDSNSALEYLLQAQTIKESRFWNRGRFFGKDLSPFGCCEPEPWKTRRFSEISPQIT